MVSDAFLDRRFSRFGALACILFAACCALSAFGEDGAAKDDADEQETGGQEPTTVSLGLGALVIPDFEGAKEHSAFPVPIIEVKNWHRFDLSLRVLSYRLYRYQNHADSEFKKVEFRLEPAIGPSVSREEDNDFLFFTRGDSKYLRGLGDVDTGLDLGLNLFLRTGPVAARLVLRQEVAGGHDGFTAALGFGTQYPFSPRTRLGADFSTTWADDTYMNTFFSIDRKQAFRSIYRKYDASSGFKDGGFGLRLTHDFTDRVSFFGTARYTRLFGDAADSPIVEGPGGSRDQFTVLMGLKYKWTFGN
jgi:MipA family protein